jgi:hypothetical protein
MPVHSHSDNYSHIIQEIFLKHYSCYLPRKTLIAFACLLWICLSSWSCLATSVNTPLTTLFLADILMSSSGWCSLVQYYFVLLGYQSGLNHIRHFISRIQLGQPCLCSFCLLPIAYLPLEISRFHRFYHKILLRSCLGNDL